MQTPADRVLALQRSAGNAAVARALLARRFDRAAYERSMAEKAKFMAWLWEGPSWRPSTGIGNFDILYEPKTGLLTVTVKCRFKFIDGKASDWEDLDIDPDEVKWDDAAKLKWKTDFMRKVSAFWSDHFTFHCTRDWWEDLHAVVKVKFVESTHKDSHYDLNVTKIPEATFRRSRVKRLKSPTKHGKSYMNSEDLGPAIHTGEREQTPAYHEAGHMLGLGDEYEDKTHTGPVAHDKLVQAEFGHGAPRKDDGRLMSEGDLIVPEYGVTFLEALRVITGMKEWSYTPKPPAPVFSEPVDGPMPAKQNPVGPQAPEIAMA